MLPNSHKYFIAKLVTDCTNLFHLETPAIMYTVKGQVAGYCDGETVEFNEKLAELNWKKFGNTVVHEVAHYIDYQTNGRKWRKNGNKYTYHDAHFYGIMHYLISNLKDKYGDLGTPGRCHEYDTTQVKTRTQRRWQYKCKAGCEHKVSTVLHNRMQKGQVRICECKAYIDKSCFTGKQL